jgi:hypothetical protein
LKWSEVRNSGLPPSNRGSLQLRIGINSPAPAAGGAAPARGLAQRLSAGRDGGGTLIMRGIEFGTAGLVLLFGLGLLFGYLAAERVMCL